jgi:hypothetical protein
MASSRKDVFMVDPEKLQIEEVAPLAGAWIETKGHGNHKGY